MVLGKYVGHWIVLLEMRLPITVRGMVFDLVHLSLPGLITPKFQTVASGLSWVLF